MDYEIVATLGPSSASPDTWQSLLAAGATAFRLNTSHLSLTELLAWLDGLGTFFDAREAQTAVVLDLQGSKWRLGTFPSIFLAAGQAVELILRQTSPSGLTLPVPHADFFRAAQASSGEIVLNDAKIRLVLEGAGGQRLLARVLLGGEISSRKGITFTDSAYRQEQLNEKDRTIVAQTGGLDWVRYAISYVRDALEMERYRAHLGRRPLIAKLERAPALREAALIARLADEVWLCRGDLGAELGLRGMAEAVASFSKQVSNLAAPALLAGQVLEHMTHNPTPTRSEICYLYEALQKGYRGVVLSDETAVGEYPVESCRAAAMFA
jgi:pyruvate kinase